MQRDLERLRTDVKQLFPGEPIDVHGNGQFVVLSGKVSTKDVIEKAANLAGGFVDKKDEVLTFCRSIRTRGPIRCFCASVSRRSAARPDRLTGCRCSRARPASTTPSAASRRSSFPRQASRDLQWSKADSKFGSDVDKRRRESSTFSDFLNFFLLSEKYDLGLAIQRAAVARSLSEPGGAESRRAERQGSELPGGRRVSGAHRPRLWQRTWRSPSSSRNSASA